MATRIFCASLITASPVLPPSQVLWFVKGFAVLNLHGIIDQGELEHILRLRVTSHIPLYAAF